MDKLNIYLADGTYDGTVIMKSTSSMQKINYLTTSHYENYWSNRR